MFSIPLLNKSIMDLEGLSTFSSSPLKWLTSFDKTGKFLKTQSAPRNKNIRFYQE